jgi:acetate kinase
MRELLLHEKDHPPSAEAVALFCHSVRKAIGALATTLDGVDTLVFSAGIGERSPVVRARICRGLSHLGIEIDATRNEATSPVISTDASRCTVRVIPTDEEAIIARDTLQLLGGSTR